MSIQVYNTLHGKKEAFVPLTPGKVKMYACGVTVYDYCHIGHARSAMVFDVIRNYLQYRGYEVLFVKNFTDVDDKIIKRAQEEGLSTQEVAEKYIQAHQEDMGKLGIRPADIEPKATEHIEDMLRMVKALVEQGIAYAVDGDVYFSVKKFPDYGKLSGRNVDDMRSGARIEIDARKRDPLDFALWKASKPGEPSWDSPWGPGRPGWHIECSTMSCRYLGETFDIHGGGKDLIFPHHENEIAQSEAYTHKPFAKYWIHNGFLSIHQEKMSKSLGNFFTIREVLNQYTPETIRLLMLSTHYRSPLDYSESRLEEAATALKRFSNTFQALDDVAARVQPATSSARLSAEQQDRLAQIPRQIDQLTQAFEAAMDDDFNTAAAIGALFDMLKVINSGIHSVAAEPAPPQDVADSLQEAGERVKHLGAVLGFTFAEDRAGSETDHALVDQLMGLLVALRKEARTEKNWALADRIRDGLTDLGIEIKDHPGGESTWTLRN
ncbi:cysteine--tRNA ligase [candidate division KSB3 bacterium]|uniref:Cysteine--tRNA ligase n=1 Tax=candidate division KSB3 bacterium TaxID=2044937 RepID=A0A9D5Q7X1_9BACT|nr:cysteine--tRNA ligase [candidate division KSB3 bacterium]MBD3326893.1 cysteine--tRNA ligase [candidate division KSB3 bacterium]